MATVKNLRSNVVGLHSLVTLMSPSILGAYMLESNNQVGFYSRSADETQQHFFYCCDGRNSR